MTSTTLTTTVTPDQIDFYRENGFLHVPQVLSPDQVATYRDAAASAYDNLSSLDADNPMFKQIVNVWESDETLRELVMHRGLAEIATELAGIPVRLWHDQLLIKKPHNQTPTEFHQDAPYWPHDNSKHQLSAWIALVDVPVERGCMTFIPGSHQRKDLRAIDLTDSADLFDAAPDLVYQPRYTVPLRAGDCTFHNGFLAHTANSNDTDDFRYSLVNIYVNEDVIFNGAGHVLTDGLGLVAGDAFPDERFPRLPQAV